MEEIQANMQLMVKTPFQKDSLSMVSYSEKRLILSEIAIHNSDQRDSDNDNPDWIEIYNRSNYDVSLSEFSITDNSDLQKWSFPNISLAPMQQYTVFS